MESFEDLLLQHGIRPTANRLLILRELDRAKMPQSMSDIELSLQSVDKSIIFRTLSLFKEHHLLHSIEDGSDGIRYELCHSSLEDHDRDLHIHFHCERCKRTYCIEECIIPRVNLPAGYIEESVNYVVKGLCPKCSMVSGVHVV